jgi:protein-tyrosine phosphatase
MLFLCYGNICRSPFAAEAMSRALLQGEGGGGDVSSAGFFGPGRPSPDAAIAAARRRGVDMNAHRSRLVAEDLALAVDCIFVMDPRQRVELNRLLPGLQTPVLVLGDLDPCRVEQRGIPDPYGKDDEFFDSTFRRIERCVGSVAGLIRTDHG